MNTSYLKNLILVILALSDIFLVLIVMSDRIQAEMVQKQGWEAVETLLETYAVTMDEGVPRHLPKPSVYNLRRSAQSEYQFMERLLGSLSAEDLGGNIWFYNSDKGQASLRGTGEMDILLTSGTWKVGRDEGSASLRFMEHLGLPCDENSLTLTEEGGSDEYILQCSWKDASVYNARLSFIYSGESLMMVSGIRVFDEIVSESSEGVMDELTAFLSFANLLDQQTWTCTSLTDLEIGYIQSVTISGESTLTPIWHFVTDTGSVYLNAMTGKVESII